MQLHHILGDVENLISNDFEVTFISINQDNGSYSKFVSGAYPLANNMFNLMNAHSSETNDCFAQINEIFFYNRTTNYGSLTVHSVYPS